MDIITRFKKSKWLRKATVSVGNAALMKRLVEDVTAVLHKDGLKGIRNRLELLLAYVKDIINGNYKDYQRTNLCLIVAALIYVVSPFDFLCDFIPFGLVDDAAIVCWVIDEVARELKAFELWRENKNKQ